jgi:two-component system CheB/CheR fusion protein
VGASAGGLEAFTQLLKLLPDDSGMAFVLIQHPDLQQPSSLGETLARATRMKVRQADDGVAVEPNHVYVIPPSAEVAMSRGRLSLMPGRLGDRLPSPSIDRFLRSLAADRGSHAIGVVLSGNASDGVEGLRAIKAEHGITSRRPRPRRALPRCPAARSRPASSIAPCPSPSWLRSWCA